MCITCARVYVCEYLGNMPGVRSSASPKLVDIKCGRMRKSVPGQGWNRTMLVPPVRQPADKKRSIINNLRRLFLFLPWLPFHLISLSRLFFFPQRSPWFVRSRRLGPKKPPPCGMWTPMAFAPGGSGMMMQGTGPPTGHGLGMTDTLTLLCVLWANFVACPACLEHDMMTAVSETPMGTLLTIIISIFFFFLWRLRTIPMQKPAFSSMTSGGQST